MKKVKTLILFTALLISFSINAQRVIDFDILFEEPYPRTIGQLIDNSRFDIIIYNDIPRDLNLYFNIEVDVHGGSNEYTITMKEKKIKSFFMAQGSDGESVRDRSLSDMGFTVDNLNNLPERFTQLDNVLDYTNTSLDEGSYTICITAYDWDTDQQLSANVCNFDAFTIESANLNLTFQDGQRFCKDGTEGSIVDNLVFDWDIDAKSNITAIECFSFNLKIAKVPIGKSPEEAIEDVSLRIGNVDGFKSDDPFFDNSELLLTDDDFENGSQYAVQVTAEDKIGAPGDCTVFLNQDGKSQVVTFSVGCDDGFGEDEQVSYNCENCNKAMPDDTEPDYSISSLSSQFKAGYYDITNVHSTGGDNNENGFSGTGITKFTLFGIENIPVKVEFEGVKINSNGRMVDGKVITVQEEYDEIEIVLEDGVDFTLDELRDQSPEQYADMVSKLHAVSDIMNDINKIANGEGLEMPLGFDQKIDNDQYKFMIEQIHFYSDRASIDISANFPTSFNNEEDTTYLALAVKDLCLTPDGTFGPGTFPLVQDISVYDNRTAGEDGYALKVNGSESSNENGGEGSFLNFDCNGIIGCNFECSILFPETVLIPQDVVEPTKVETLDGGLVSGIDVTLPIDNRVAARFALLFGNTSQDNSKSGWMVDVSISPFAFVGLDNWTFEVQHATIDMSKSANPQELNFPVNYTTYGPKKDFNNNEELIYPPNDIMNNWTGIFIKEVNITPPRSLRGDVFRGFSVENTIIDFNDGSMKFSSFIGVQTPYRNELKLGNWKMTMDKIGITILENSFIDGGFEGKLYSPLVHRNDYFNYKSLIFKNDNRETDYMFSINVPTKADGKSLVRIPMWMAQAKLSKESHITLTTDTKDKDSDFAFNVNFVGNLHLSQKGAQTVVENFEETKDVPLELIGVPFYLKYNKKDGFEGKLGLTAMYEKFIDGVKKDLEKDMETIESIGQDIGRGGKKKQELAGFQLTFTDVSIGGSLNYPKLTLAPRVHLMSDDEENSPDEKKGFGIDTKIVFEGEFKNGRYELKDSHLECGGLDVQMSKFSFRGNICYKQENKEFGGRLMVDFPMFGINVRGSFGTKFKNNKPDYRYWNLRALSRFSKGIPLGGSGLDLYGIGGGFMWNCKYKNRNQIKNLGRYEFATLPTTVVDDPSNNSIYDQYEIVPSKKAMYINFTGLFGTSKEPSAFNFDATISADLNQNSKLDFGGKFYVMNEIFDPPTNPYVVGSLLARMEINNIKTGDVAMYTINKNGAKGVDLQNKVIINLPNPKPVISGKIWYDFMLNPKENKFHLWVGAPEGHTDLGGPGKLNVDLLTIDFDVSSYLMIGSGLPSSIHLPREIDEYFKGTTSQSTDDGQGTLKNTIGSLNKPRPYTDVFGIAFGSGFKASINLGDPSSFNIYGNVLAGFDLNITRSLSRTCYIDEKGGYRNPGFKGWYAMGQFYVGMDAGVKVFGAKIAQAKAVLLAQGATPSPTWARLKGKVHYKIWGGWLTNGIANTVDCAGAVLTLGLFGDCDYTEDHTQGNLEFDEVFGNGKKSCMPSPKQEVQIPDLMSHFSISDSRKMGVGRKKGSTWTNNNLTINDNDENVSYKLDVLKIHLNIPTCKNTSVSGIVNNEYVTGSTHTTFDYLELKEEGKSVKQKYGSHGDFEEDCYSSHLIFDLSPNTTYTLTAKVKIVWIDGKTYRQTLSVTFKTKDLTGEIGTCLNPKNYELFYHKNDRSKDLKISFTSDEFNRYFKGNLGSPANGNNPILKITKIHNDAHVDYTPLVSSDFIGNTLIYELPKLDPQIQYRIEIVKYKPGGGWLPIHHTVFRTSLYSTLVEKIEAINKKVVSYETQNGSVNVLKLKEPFDKIELGYYDVGFAGKDESLTNQFENVFTPFITRLNDELDKEQEVKVKYYISAPGRKNHTVENRKSVVFKLKNSVSLKIKPEKKSLFTNNKLKVLGINLASMKSGYVSKTILSRWDDSPSEFIKLLENDEQTFLEFAEFYINKNGQNSSSAWGNITMSPFEYIIIPDLPNPYAKYKEKFDAIDIEYFGVSNYTGLLYKNLKFTNQNVKTFIVKPYKTYLNKYFPDFRAKFKLCGTELEKLKSAKLNKYQLIVSTYMKSISINIEL